MSSAQAHSYAEYEEMLKLFRCQDLANLLTFAGQSKNGKKSELYDRCLSILKKGSPSIQLKIREIHNSRLASASGNTYNGFISAVTSSCSSSTSNSPDPMQLNSHSNPIRYNGGVINPPNVLNSIAMAAVAAVTGSNNYNQFSSYGQLPFGSSGQTANSFHPQSGLGGLHSLSDSGSNTMQTRSSSSLINNNNGHHSSTRSDNVKVHFEKLAFFEFISELGQPLRMTPIQPNQRPLSFWFNFFMNPDQANQIIETREMINGKLEYTKQIHLRFGYYENAQQVDSLPANLIVNVNGKPAALPTPKPTSKPNADIIRPGRSIDITNLCRLAPNMANKVELNWTNLDPNRTHCVAVYLFKRVSVASLVQQLKTNCTKDAEITRKMVREKLQISDSDFEIETTEYKVSLMCPLMKFRMHLPGRSYTCKHVQCFDVESYLMMNEKKPTWNCPVCDQHVPFDNLIIDNLFQEILKKTNDIEEVQFTADGEWSIVKPNDKAATSSSSSSTKKTVVHKSNDDHKQINMTIKVDDEDIDLCDESSLNSSTSNTNGAASSAPAAKEPAKNLDVIDLTLDSDDEGPSKAPPPPPSRHPSMQINQSKQTSVNNNNNNINKNIKQARSNSQSSTSSGFESTSNYSSAVHTANESNDAYTNSSSTSLNNNPHLRKQLSSTSSENTYNNGPTSPAASVISISSSGSPGSSLDSPITPPNQRQKSNDQHQIGSNNRDKVKSPISTVSQPLTVSTNDIRSNSASSSGSSSSSSSASSSSTLPSLSPMDTRIATPPSLVQNNSSLGGSNSSMNSRLARDLSMPSPTKNHMNNIDNMTGQSLNKQTPSLASVNSIFETVNQPINKSPRLLPSSTSSSSLSSSNSHHQSINNNNINNNHIPSSSLSNYNENLANKKPSSSSSINPSNNPYPKSSSGYQQQSVPQSKNSQNHLNSQQQQQQQLQKQRPIEHKLVNNPSSKISSSNKLPNRKPEYINQEKISLLQEELRSNRSPNPNQMEIDNPGNVNNSQNYVLREQPLASKVLRKPTFDPSDIRSTSESRSNISPNQNINRPVNLTGSSSKQPQNNQQQQRPNIPNNYNNMQAKPAQPQPINRNPQQQVPQRNMVNQPGMKNPSPISPNPNKSPLNKSPNSTSMGSGSNGPFFHKNPNVPGMPSSSVHSSSSNRPINGQNQSQHMNGANMPNNRMNPSSSSAGSNRPNQPMPSSSGTLYPLGSKPSGSSSSINASGSMLNNNQSKAQNPGMQPRTSQYSPNSIPSPSLFQQQPSYSNAHSSHHSHHHQSNQSIQNR